MALVVYGESQRNLSITCPDLSRETVQNLANSNGNAYSKSWSQPGRRATQGDFVSLGEPRIALTSAADIPCRINSKLSRKRRRSALWRKIPALHRAAAISAVTMPHFFKAQPSLLIIISIYVVLNIAPGRARYFVSYRSILQVEIGSLAQSLAWQCIIRGKANFKHRYPEDRRYLA